MNNQIRVYTAEAEFNENSHLQSTTAKQNTTLSQLYSDGWRLVAVSIIPDGAEPFRSHLIVEKVQPAHT